MPLHPHRSGDGDGRQPLSLPHNLGWGRRGWPQGPPAHPAGLPLPLAVPMAPKPLVLIALNAFKQTGPSPLPAPRAMPARFWAGWLRRLERDLGEIKGQEPGQISPRTDRRVSGGGDTQVSGLLEQGSGTPAPIRSPPPPPSRLRSPPLPLHGAPQGDSPAPWGPQRAFFGGGERPNPTALGTARLERGGEAPANEGE